MNMFEKTISSENVYEGKLINIRRDKIQLKGRYFTREVIEHPGSVAIVPMPDEKTILMVEQYRHAIGKSILEIPAGTLEKNESALECAHRELIEETGYEAEELIKLIGCYLAPGYSTELIQIFLATRIKKTKQNLEKDEHINVLPIDLEEANKKIRNGEIEDAKTIVGIACLQLFMVTQ